ncbi:cation-translocating P-type ATPase [Actinacidiphila oryziradicis]|uniref:cation-translocating P-type ATPase n=1 Tax=Actinacidiphila oryziradicis TaxID=2571141 RepID=UPI0023EFD4CB|nr:cation-translocating P-type ATPase [Actinacidiphila oryziradicis]MCW2870050.1 cation-transporting ATPase [Actinacidiphila oryziradicis]
MVTLALVRRAVVMGPMLSVARTGRGVAGGARSTAGAVAGLPVRAARSSVRRVLPGCVSVATRTIGDLGPSRRRRNVWSGPGRAHIEVRGLTGHEPRHRELAEAVTSALNRIEGVDWAEVNAVTAQALVSFDEDAVSPDDLVDAIESVEEDHETSGETFPWRPQHPADPTIFLPPVTALAVDVVAMGVAVSGRFQRLSRLPRGARAPIAFIDAQPRLREAVVRRLGPINTDLLLGVTNAVAHALARSPAPIALDMLFRVIHLAELQARRAVWVRREPELCARGRLVPQVRHTTRPRPAALPQGPIERLADRASVVSLAAGAGVLAWTRDPREAGYAILLLIPKAARLGREVFAAALDRHLAGRGVVPLDGSAYRRLDRVDTVVIDTDVLCGTRPQILSAVATSPKTDDAKVWRIASKVIRGLDPAEMRGDGPWTRDPWSLRPAPDAPRGRVDGPTAMTLDLLDAEGTQVGRVRVGCELDPLADALLTAARASVDKLVLTDHDSAAELLPWADNILPRDTALADRIRDLQAEGHGVVLVAAGHDDALDAADIGVAELRDDRPVPWAADLLAGPGLHEICRLMPAIPAARHASERSAQVGVGGSALGALVATVGEGQRKRSALSMAPVHSAALLSVLIGAQGARSVIRKPDPQPVARAAWHAVTAEDALVRLRAVRGDLTTEREAPPQGVSAALEAVRTRLMPPGGLPKPPPLLASTVSTLVVAPARGTAELLKAMSEELHDPLTPVLALGAAASAIVGSSVDAWLVSSVMTGNAAVSSLQRIRAERALSKLLISEEVPARQVLWTPPDSDTVADLFADLDTAECETVPGRRLRVGDIIKLSPTDVVPADARLLTAEDLEVDESSLTGESLPVAKSIDPTPGAVLGDRTCMVFDGTAVLAGTGHAVVVATGSATQAGRATAAASRAAPPAGVQVHLSELTRVALPATGFAGLAVTGLALLRGSGLRQAMSSGIAIAVAAVPEGLPLVATVSQLAAARRLSRRGVLVRSSRSLEALGRVDTICFDKTGTLTEGRLAVTRLAGPGGDIGLDSALGRRLLQVAAHASPQPDGTGTVAMAHATDRAIVEAAREHRALEDDWWLIDELPFETSRGYSASLGKEHGRLHLAVKGAPEVVLARCSSVLSARAKGQRPKAKDAVIAAPDGVAVAALKDTTPTTPMTPARQRAAQALVHQLAEDGLRVLAVAERHLLDEQDPADIEVADQVEDLTLLGFVAIADIPRPSAAAAIKRLSEVGVRVTMITGDHPVTAVAIANMLGIPDVDRVLTGGELEKLPEDERIARIEQSTIFARVSPEQKVGIVQALQRAGHVVAMTGDGSNDAPAIRLADVGIGVSGHGSAIARNAADLVLADPDMTRIVDAVLEGRALWGSVRDAVSILVGGNAGEVAFTLLATAIAGQAPLGTRQFLLVNLLTDMLPSLAVALAPAKLAEDESDQLAAGPVPSVLGPELSRTIAVRGAATAFGATLAWQLGCMTGRRTRASTMALGALVGAELGQTLLTSSHSLLVVATTGVSAAIMVAIVQTPGISGFFQCTPLGPVAWALVLASAAAATATAVIASRAVTERPTRRAITPGTPRETAAIPH